MLAGTSDPYPDKRGVVKDKIKSFILGVKERAGWCVPLFMGSPLEEPMK